MISQIRRAALSVQLTVAEGCSKKSIAEGKRFYEIGRGSTIEVDTAPDIAVNLTYMTKDPLKEPGELMVRSFQQLSKMIS